MKNKSKFENKKILSGGILSLLCLQAGCFGTSLESPGSRTLAHESSFPPVVEAMIEYSGPSKMWAGPSNWVIHLAMDRSQNQHPKVTFMTEESNASAAQSSGDLTAVLISTQEAKDALTQLRSAVSEDVLPLRGCLLPIRIQLVQMNGAVIEKRACRDQPGWPQAAEGWVRHWVTLIEES